MCLALLYGANKLYIDKRTPFDIKLRLVKVFRHMHQDIGMARQAKLTCLVLLQDPTTDSELIIVTLRTLTLLLSQAVIDRKEQVSIVPINRAKSVYSNIIYTCRSIVY